MAICEGVSKRLDKEEYYLANYPTYSNCVCLFRRRGQRGYAKVRVRSTRVRAFNSLMEMDRTYLLYQKKNHSRIEVFDARTGELVWCFKG